MNINFFFRDTGITATAVNQRYSSAILLNFCQECK